MARKGSCCCMLFQSAQEKRQLVSLLLQTSVFNRQTILLALCSSAHSKYFLNSGYLLGLCLMVSLHIPCLSYEGFTFPLNALGPHHSPSPS